MHGNDRYSATATSTKIIKNSTPNPSASIRAIRRVSGRGLALSSGVVMRSAPVYRKSTRGEVAGGSASTGDAASTSQGRGEPRGSRRRRSRSQVGARRKSLMRPSLDTECRQRWCRLWRASAHRLQEVRGLQRPLPPSLLPASPFARTWVAPSLFIQILWSPLRSGPSALTVMKPVQVLHYQGR